MKYKIRIAIIGSILLFSCDQEEVLVLSTGKESDTNRHYQIGKEMISVLDQKLDSKCVLLTEGEGSKNNCYHVIDHKSQLGLAQNNVQLTQKDKGSLMTVLALYPQTLFILHKPDIQPSTIEDLVVDRTIAIGPETGGTHGFVKELLLHFGIDTMQYTFVFSEYKNNVLSDTIDVSISLTGFNDERIEKMLANGAQIWSFGDPDRPIENSPASGFCLSHPFTRPFIIPQFTYDGSPARPILTLAVDNVLVANAQLDKQLVYDVITVLVENKETLIKQDVLFQFLTNQFGDRTFQFPLHPGAIAYINRHRPGLLEKYAGRIGTILTLITALSIFYAFVKKLKELIIKRRLKAYCNEVEEIRKKVIVSCDLAERQLVYDRLNELRSLFLSELMVDRLKADEKFSVFLELIGETLHDLRQQMDYDERKLSSVSESV